MHISKYNLSIKNPLHSIPYSPSHPSGNAWLLAAQTKQTEQMPSRLTTQCSLPGKWLFQRFHFVDEQIGGKNSQVCCLCTLKFSGKIDIYNLFTIAKCKNKWETFPTGFFSREGEIMTLPVQKKKREKATNLVTCIFQSQYYLKHHLQGSQNSHMGSLYYNHSYFQDTQRSAKVQ